MRSKGMWIAFAFLFVVRTASGTPPPDSLYLEAADATTGVVLIHGRGMKADSFVVGPMRRMLNEDSRFHTISLQLPATTAVEKTSPEQKLADMKAIYSQSRDLIRIAAGFLRDQGVKRVYLLAHSMGATIAATMLVSDGPSGFAGLVTVGAGDYVEPPFNTTENMKRLSSILPVLDVYGDSEGIRHEVDRALAEDDVALASKRAAFESTYYRQVRIGSAGHVFFAKAKQEELASVVSEWIGETDKKYGGSK